MMNCTGKVCPQGQLQIDARHDSAKEQWKWPVVILIKQGESEPKRLHGKLWVKF